MLATVAKALTHERTKEQMLLVWVTTHFLTTAQCGQSLDKFILELFHPKAELLQEGIFLLIHLFARDVLGMKKLEIEKTKPSFIISVLKVEY